MIKNKNIKEKAEIYACRMHGKTGQMYDNNPYHFHLRGVVEVAERFIHLIPSKDIDNVISGCWSHDLIEDAGVTYNDVLGATNLVVAEYAYALTNEKGRNRAERANSKYYYDIRVYKHASFIKLCDRIFNIEYSKAHGSRMFEMYKKEHRKFKSELYDDRWKEMWEHIEKLLK